MKEFITIAINADGSPSMRYGRHFLGEDASVDETSRAFRAARDMIVEARDAFEAARIETLVELASGKLAEEGVA